MSTVRERRKIGLICKLWKDSHLFLCMWLCWATEREKNARGTCSGALAKSPIITSKLDFAGGGLSDTGALWRMKHRTEIGVESLLPLSAFPLFSLLPPLHLLLSFISSLSSTLSYLPYLFPFLPLYSITSSLHLIFVFNTWPAGWQSLYELSFFFPLPSLVNFTILLGL